MARKALLMFGWLVLNTMKAIRERNEEIDMPDLQSFSSHLKSKYEKILILISLRIRWTTTHLTHLLGASYQVLAARLLFIKIEGTNDANAIYLNFFSSSFSSLSN
jgi:hypothetical protein